MAKKNTSLAGLANATELQQKQARLNDILDSWKKYPGRAPGGTGETGLLSTDKEGYSKMLNEQTEAMNLQNELGGKGPVQVKQAPLHEVHYDSNGYVPEQDQQLGKNGPTYGEASFWDPYSVDQYRQGRGALQGLQRLVS